MGLIKYVVTLALAGSLLVVTDVRGTEARAAPPTRGECLALALGSTGLPLVGGQIPSLSGLLGGGNGFGKVAPDGLSLPDRVVLTDRRHAISNEYAFALRKGDMYVRQAREGTPAAGTSWHRLQLPSCLAGRVAAISADHRLLTVLDTDGQLYSHDMPGGDLSADRWTWRWGPFLWLGAGMKMFSGVRDWDISEFNSAETFTDTAGRSHHPIGVATGYLLRKDRRTITYIDPWLPADESREVCGPRRGRLALAAIDASGSTLFAAATNGSLWTRLYDFDLAGANSLLGKYTWQDGQPATADIWQLPAPGWVRQTRPGGRVTDRLTIVKTGPDATNRQLRIEGRHRDGRRGYWTKSITAVKWKFHATGERLRGKALTGKVRLAAARDHRYVGTIGDHPAEVSNFNAACSGADIVVTVAPGQQLALRLHSEDALRQATRGPGLDDVPRSYNAAIEVPAATWRSLAAAPVAVREFVATHLSGRITELPIAVTATRLRMPYQCWEMTLEGRPARPDKAPNLLDVGTLLGFLRDVPAQAALPTC